MICIVSRKEKDYDLRMTLVFWKDFSEPLLPFQDYTC
jgi:hypothetical protein